MITVIPNDWRKNITVNNTTMTVTIKDQVIRFLYNHLKNQFLVSAIFVSGLFQKQ
jgi:hypothetical protein